MAGTMKVPRRCQDGISRHERLDSVCRFFGRYRKRLTSTIALIARLLGALTSVKAIMETRTSQGVIAWAISLNTMPYVAVPAHWVFGRSDFNEYITARRTERENFEITMGVDDETFTAEVAEMLENDFANARKVAEGEFDEKSSWFRFWSRVSRLTAPIQ